MPSRNDAIYVTGADARFARNLHQLLRAVLRHRWNVDAHWVIFDLGMTADQRRDLMQSFPWIEVRTLDLEKLPPHYVPSYGAYAWKAHIVWEVAEHAKGPVIWMDSANLPRGSAQPMLDWIHTHGFYMLHGRSPLLARCDRRMLERLGVPRWLWGSRELASGLVGADMARPEMRKLLQDWATLSDDEDIIRPKPDTFRGHRNDQSVLNALVQPLAALGHIKLPNLDIDISAPDPVKFLSTRNKLKPTTPLWADPLMRARYGLIKAVDQLAIRTNKLINRRWFPSRWRGEYFELRTTKRGQPDQTVIPCPAGHYYADPFLWDHDGQPWVFFADFHYFSMRGTIAAMPLDGKQKAVRVLDPGVHASFPFLFRHAGKLWMMPETCKNGRLDLYECTRFPDQWHRHRTVFEDVNTVDTVVFKHNGLWWLMTSMKSPQAGGPQRYLAIYYSDDPVDGIWHPHPVNVEGREITSAHGTGRNAGAVFEHDGQLIRCVQSSRDYYSQGMELRAMTLTRESFTERKIATPDDLTMIDAEGVHHVSQLGDRIVWDRRTRH